MHFLCDRIQRRTLDCGDSFNDYRGNLFCHINWLLGKLICFFDKIFYVTLSDYPVEVKLRSFPKGSSSVLEQVHIKSRVLGMSTAKVNPFGII